MSTCLGQSGKFPSCDPWARVADSESEWPTLVNFRYHEQAGCQLARTVPASPSKQEFEGGASEEAGCALCEADTADTSADAASMHALIELNQLKPKPRMR